MAGETLRPDGQPVELQDLGFVIVSNTLAADITTYPGSVTGARSGGPGLSQPVLQSADVRELGTVILQDHQPERAQEKTVSLYVPGGYEEDGRLLLYFDEAGGVSFHLPQSERRPPPAVRAGQEKTVRFDIPIREPVEKSSDAAPVRGVGGMLAKKVLKVIGWKVVGMAARLVGPPLVRLWEDKFRPLRLLSHETLFLPNPEPLAECIPTAARALLFIHGTFSRVSSAFTGIPEDTAFQASIRQCYREHIYGFDHATLATGVATNVMQLYEKLSPGIHNFDIICHSRGGLVARALRDLTETQLKELFGQDAERGNYDAELKAWGERWRMPRGVQVNVSRILFVATPNNGTILAQPTHLKKYLEILMTATNLLPDVVDIAVDGILTVGKLLLTEVMPKLPGLDDQRPESTLLSLLKNKPGENDSAIQTDYEPPEGLNAIMRLADSGMDFVFGDKVNDLVVPTEGVSQWVGGQFLPPRLLVFNKDKGVHHCNLFRQSQTHSHLLACLT